MIFYRFFQSIFPFFRSACVLVFFHLSLQTKAVTLNEWTVLSTHRSHELQWRGTFSIGNLLDSSRNRGRGAFIALQMKVRLVLCEALHSSAELVIFCEADNSVFWCLFFNPPKNLTASAFTMKHLDWRFTLYAPWKRSLVTVRSSSWVSQHTDAVAEVCSRSQKALQKKVRRNPGGGSGCGWDLNYRLPSHGDVGTRTKLVRERLSFGTAPSNCCGFNLLSALSSSVNRPGAVATSSRFELRGCDALLVLRFQLPQWLWFARKGWGIFFP